MEWRTEVYDLFVKITDRIPEGFRTSVKPMLQDTAEKKCLDRQGNSVNESDLICALLEITPEPFKPSAISDLETLEVDYKKYLDKKEEPEVASSGFKLNTDLEQLIDDIAKAADLADVPCDKDKVWEVLQAFEPFFKGSTISFVTNTKPKEKRKLSVRYIELGVPHDAYAIALEAGLITKENHPIYDMIPEIQAKYPIMGYGVDLDSQYGLAKIWVFFQIPQPLEKAYSMTSVPKAIQNYKDYFSKFGLTDFHLFALDFQNKSINLYFMVKDSSLFPPEKIAGMIGDLGLTVPSKEVLEYCTGATTIYCSFTWDSPNTERICFGMAALEPGSVPTHLDPLIERYHTTAPILTPKRNFIYSITPSHSGDYIKIESDYTGTMVDLMQTGAQAEVWLDELKQHHDTNVEKGIIITKNFEWESGIDKLFNNIVAGIPDAFREMVRPLLLETTEKICENRKGGIVNEGDLLKALFEITPDAFKPEAINNLKVLGVDYQKYLNS